MDKHKQIFQGIEKLHEETKTVELATLCSKLPAIPASEIVGLLTGVPPPTKDGMRSVIKRLQEFRKRREQFALAYRLQQSVQVDDPEATEKVMEQIKATEKKEEGEEIIGIDELIKGYEDYQSRGEGIKFGIPSFDRITRGIGEGEVCLVLGYAGTGKSAIAQNVLRNFATNYPNDSAIFFSLEMPRAQLGERILELETGKGREQLHTITDKEKEEIRERNKSIFYIDSPTKDLRSIYRTIVQLKFQGNVRLVIVDFLQRVQSKITDEYDFLRKATKYFKDIAKELKVALILLSQVSRERSGEGWRPLMLRSGRGSGTLEEDADFVLGIYRPELKPGITADEQFKVQDKIMLQMLKSRRTLLVPRIELGFNKDSLRIFELGVD